MCRSRPKFAPERRWQIVGSGAAGLAAAQQLARVGHEVTVFEKNDRIGGLLRYGIPDFKMEKSHIDRRIEQMAAEGVTFRTGVLVGELGGAPVTNWAIETVDPKQLLADFDAVILSGGAEQPRDLPVPGRQLDGRALRDGLFAVAEQDRSPETRSTDQIVATGKHVIVIGGGDTGRIASAPAIGMVQKA